MSDTETLQRQVTQLTNERDQARDELAKAYKALEQAGAKAREMRADLKRMSEQVAELVADR